MFDTPRAWMVHLLSVKEAPLAAVAAANLDTNTTVSSTTETATSSLSQDAPPLPTPRTTYEYKLLTSGVTACQLTVLGADGWHAIQFGGTLMTGYDPEAACRKFGAVDSLDWVLLERPSTPAQ
ncbi:MAG: hypothetical protein ACHQU0_00490 [Candidatus Paceibacteria bacterium]